MVTVVGLGFVGLTTALGLCEFGNTVYGIDANVKRAKTISSGKIPFVEPGLDVALTKYLNNKFFVTDDWDKAIADSDAIFYCVGTPYGENGAADLTYLFGAIDQTVESIKDDKKRVLVTKSTVPPSTAKTKVIPYINEKHSDKKSQIAVANNPEFLREGHCWDDFVNADRIVIGSEDDFARETINKLYCNSNSEIKNVSLNTAEFIKYLSNTTLACMISYANEMSLAADAIGDIDVADAFRILHTDKRWQTGSIRSYMYPGCGYGGYCLPKDTNAFYSLLHEMGYDCKMLEQAIKLNDNMAKNTANKIAAKCESKETVIGILGLSFNVGSDDVRDTPAAKIIKELNAEGYSNIVVYDPVATQNFKETYSEISVKAVSSYAELLDVAEVIAIVTAWEEFSNIKSLTDKPIIDCRYMLK